MAGGVAAFDYDNDGFLDLFFTNGAAIPSLEKTGPKYWNRLYHNNGDGTFTDVTEKAGVGAWATPWASPREITTTMDSWTSMLRESTEINCSTITATAPLPM